MCGCTCQCLFPHYFVNTLFKLRDFFSSLRGEKQDLSIVVIHISLMTEIEHLFKCLKAICILFFVNSLFIALFIFLCWWSCSFYFQRSLFIRNVNHLSVRQIANIFFTVCHFWKFILKLVASTIFFFHSINPVGKLSLCHLKIVMFSLCGLVCDYPLFFFFFPTKVRGKEGNPEVVTWFLFYFFTQTSPIR